MNDDLVPAPRPRLIGFPFAAGLVAAIGMLAVATFLPWLANLSGWDLLSSVNRDALSPFAWWAVVLVPVTVLLGAVALRWGNRPARLPLVLVTLAASVGLIVDAGHGRFGWPGSGLGLALAGYPAAFLFAVVLLARPRWRLPAPDRAALVLGLALAVGLAGMIAVGGWWYTDRIAVDATTSGGTPAMRVTGRPGQELARVPATVINASSVVVLADGLVGGTRRDGDVRVWSAADGAVRWHYRRPDAVASVLGASRDGRTLVAEYFADKRHALLGFDAATGAIRWQWWVPKDAVGGQVDMFPDAVIDTRFAGGGTVVALDPTTGRQRWLVRDFWGGGQRGCGYRLPDGGKASVASDGDMTVLVAYCADIERGEARAVDRSGRPLWKISDPDGPHESIGGQEDEVLAVRNDAVVIASNVRDQLRVLDPATGRTRWTAHYVRALGRLLGLDGGSILLANDPADGKPTELALHDLATGAPRAIAGLPDHAYVESGADVRDGHAELVTVDRDAGLGRVGLDLASGRVTGVDRLPERVDPATVTPDNAAIVAAGQGYALILDPDRGTVATVVLGPPAG